MEDGMLDRLMPKRRPLAQALLEAAAEQGATAEEFRAACAMIEDRIERRSSQVLIAELVGEG